ncbi:transposase [bacterium]|nr:transposase [bacterium]
MPWWRADRPTTLAVLVKLPFAARRWALPVLVDLYRPPEVNAAEGRCHRTPARLMCRLLRVRLVRSNVILYQARNGCTWRDLPKDLPPYRVAFHSFRA